MSDGQGRGWQVNPDGIAHLLRSSHYNRLVLQRARTVRVSHGFMLPSTTEVEIDFTGIRDETTKLATLYIKDSLQKMAGSPKQVYEFLVLAREDGANSGDAYRRMMQQATQESMRAINSNVSMWENAEAVAKVTRDVCAGALLIGASILTGGTAAAGATAVGGVSLGSATAVGVGVGTVGTGLTFTGNTQDNLSAGQTMRQAMGNAAVSTTVAVVTNWLIPGGLGRASKGMAGSDMTKNVVLGLVTTQANIAGDMIKTALTADAASGPAAQQAQQQFQKQVAARTGWEIGSMLFQSWLSARGIPAAAFLKNSGDAANTMAGAALSVIGDKIVTAMSTQDKQALHALPGGAKAGDLDLAFTQLQKTVEAEAYVREVAMRPL